MGKVPAISDGPVKLADSAAIGIYLADRYPEAGLAPAIDHPDRGRYLFWMTYTPGVIEPAMSEKFNGWDVNPAQSGWGSFDLMIATLERGLQSGPWLLGEHFSAADVLVGSSVNFIRMFGILPESPTLSDYVDRCLARPAYALALARENG
jgi:glutathione S-transferase